MNDGAVSGLGVERPTAFDRGRDFRMGRGRARDGDMVERGEAGGSGYDVGADKGNRQVQLEGRASSSRQ